MSCRGSGARWPRFTDNSTWGDTMRRVIIRSLTATAVLGGIILTGAGVAAAAPGSGAGVAAAGPGGQVGGDNSSSATCGASDIDLKQGCFLGVGRLFK